MSKTLSERIKKTEQKLYEAKKKNKGNYILPDKGNPEAMAKWNARFDVEGKHGDGMLNGTFANSSAEGAGSADGGMGEGLENSLKEAKRYVRRYYIRPQDIFCSNKAEILKALIDIDNDNCTVYTLNNLGDEKDVNKLTNDDIIYYYDDGILYDKNKVKVMDYDLYIKHEEKRDNIKPEQVSDAKFSDVYDDRMTDATELEEALSRAIKMLNEDKNTNSVFWAIAKKILIIVLGVGVAIPMVLIMLVVKIIKSILSFLKLTKKEASFEEKVQETIKCRDEVDQSIAELRTQLPAEKVDKLLGLVNKYFAVQPVDFSNLTDEEIRAKVAEKEAADLVNSGVLNKEGKVKDDLFAEDEIGESLVEMAATKKLIANKKNLKEGVLTEAEEKILLSNQDREELSKAISVGRSPETNRIKLTIKNKEIVYELLDDLLSAGNDEYRAAADIAFKAIKDLNDDDIVRTTKSTTDFSAKDYISKVLSAYYIDNKTLKTKIATSKARSMTGSLDSAVEESIKIKSQKAGLIWAIIYNYILSGGYGRVAVFSETMTEADKDWFKKHVTNIHFYIPLDDTNGTYWVGEEKHFNDLFANAKRKPEEGKDYTYRRNSTSKDTHYDFWHISAITTFDTKIGDIPKTDEKGRALNIQGLINIAKRTAAINGMGPKDKKIKFASDLDEEYSVNSRPFAEWLLKAFNYDLDFYKNKDTEEEVTEACSRSGKLDEEKMFVSKLLRLGVDANVELPGFIHLLNKDEVDKTIDHLKPEELFIAGYITPLYFYKKLWDNCTVLKCTELWGYTGVDWSDTDEEESGMTADAAAERQANAADEIANNRQKSVVYDKTNKVVQQGYVNPETGYRSGTLLYYPKSGSTPKVTYFIDLHDGNGYTNVSKDVLEETLFKWLTELMGDKKTPDEIRNNISKQLRIDAATTDGQVFKPQLGSSRYAMDTKLRPQVRALYLNQLYYLETNHTTLGEPIVDKFITESVHKHEFDLEFDDYNAYGEKLHEGKEIDGICCICGEEIDGYGNNAEPYKKGRCCDACNLHCVIPARFNMLDEE